MSTKTDFHRVPWEDWDEHSLKEQLNRMYAALTDAASVLRVLQVGEEANPFWKRGGSGHHASHQCEQVLSALHSAYDEQAMHRRFFRMARCVYFPEVNIPWVVCPACGNAFGGDGVQKYVGMPCDSQPFGKPDCQGRYRMAVIDDVTLPST